MSKIKVEQNIHSSIAAILESLGSRKNPTEYGSTIRPTSEQGLVKCDSDETDTKIPFELIVSCVAAYHMIQVSSKV